jgi:NADPH-dependent 7-cyano-7-deazaguanine reductase QueF
VIFPTFTISIRCHLFNSLCPMSIFSVSMGTF